MDKDTELEIASGLRAGNRQAWLQLYDAYAERLWTDVGRRMGFDCEEAADVVQEIFLAAARSAKGFNANRGSLWAWLWGIGRRQIALYYRKQAPKATFAQARLWLVSLDGRKNWIDAKSEPPQDIVETREMAALVRLALSELPGEYQTLLLAKYVDGQAIDTMAGDLNCSHSAVASKLARARKAFRRTLRKLRITVRSVPDTTEVSS